MKIVDNEPDTALRRMLLVRQGLLLDHQTLCRKKSKSNQYNWTKYLTNKKGGLTRKDSNRTKIYLHNEKPVTGKAKVGASTYRSHFVHRSVLVPDFDPQSRVSFIMYVSIHRLACIPSTASIKFIVRQENIYM